LTNSERGVETMGEEPVKVGVIICDRYHTCAGGKCFKAAEKREGGFARYKGKPMQIAAFSHCGGCPGGNIEYTPQEMKNNGIQVIYLATCMLVGYPPCPRIDYFRRFMREKYGVEVIVGTHPIPEKYMVVHDGLHTWDSSAWQELISNVLTDPETRLSYN